jgi:hypothetical protein
LSAARRPSSLVLSLLLAVGVVGFPAAPALAADPGPPGDCPEVMPIEEVSAGQTGFGWTVVRGGEPRPFAVEVLGVYPDGVLPDHDLILVRVSDTGSHRYIANAGGLWAGMSGSPVYIDGRLVGSVSYGFSLGPSTLGGLTPIDEMLEVVEREPDATVADLSPRLLRALRQAGPASVQASAFGRLALPMALPASPRHAPKGASRKRELAMRARFDLPARLERMGVAAVPVSSPARGARHGVAAADRPVAGGNLAAMLSNGDLRVFATGTTTWVCRQRVLAFGHPMLQTGQTDMAMHLADSLDIVDDPTATPYKLAVPGPLVGRIGQDRTSAVAGRLDRTPQTLVVTSETRQYPGGRSRQGTSRITVQTPRFWQWELPAYHAAANVLAVVDAFEEGSVGITLQVRGRRANGTPFEATFGDRLIGSRSPDAFAYDTNEAALFGVGTYLSWIVENPFERVTLDSIDMDLDLRPTATYELVGLTVARNGTRAGVGPLCVAPGDQLTVRAQLASVPGGDIVQRRFEFDVPRQFRYLTVGAGPGLSPWMDPREMASGFGGLLRSLGQRARSDELMARITADGSVRAEDRRQLRRVTYGSMRIPLLRLGSAACE